MYKYKNKTQKRKLNRQVPKLGRKKVIAPVHLVLSPFLNECQFPFFICLSYQREIDYLFFKVSKGVVQIT